MKIFSAKKPKKCKTKSKPVDLRVFDERLVALHVQQNDHVRNRVDLAVRRHLPQLSHELRLGKLVHRQKPLPARAPHVLVEVRDHRLRHWHYQRRFFASVGLIVAR